MAGTKFLLGTALPAQPKGSPCGTSPALGHDPRLLRLDLGRPWSGQANPAPSGTNFNTGTELSPGPASPPSPFTILLPGSFKGNVRVAWRRSAFYWGGYQCQ